RTGHTNHRTSTDSIADPGTNATDRPVRRRGVSIAVQPGKGRIRRPRHGPDPRHLRADSDRTLSGQGAVMIDVPYGPAVPHREGLHAPVRARRIDGVAVIAAEEIRHTVLIEIPDAEDRVPWSIDRPDHRARGSREHHHTEVRREEVAGRRVIGHAIAIDV